ncbi:hypothetical protein BaRGS_00014583 [Batillaria attramentaria]|uniref:Uncharacterized protein n=1 Tax=Batillaria attramentaria TaxID=370345 RepID=A0ABD0L4P8_9CAEN
MANGRSVMARDGVDQTSSSSPPHNIHIVNKTLGKSLERERSVHLSGCDGPGVPWHGSKGQAILLQEYITKPSDRPCDEGAKWRAPRSINFLRGDDYLPWSRE